MTTDRNERVRDGMPWGWWLRAGPGGLEDGEGCVWPTVRAAFWEGRLGMQSGHAAAEQQELMLRVLADLDVAGPSRVATDVFEGDAFFWRFYMCWLGSIGMTVVPGRVTALEGRLSVEGRAAMLMLRATRDPQWTDLPMREVVEAVERAGRGEEHDALQAALRAFERGTTRRRHVFSRERAGRAYLVVLTSIDPLQRMPTRRVVWSASFLNERTRDDLFGWLAGRVHRWDDWGAKVRKLGARALSDHLLALSIVDPVGVERSGPSMDGRS